MARVDRGVAQRYAAKRRKKRPAGPRTYTPARVEAESRPSTDSDDDTLAAEYQAARQQTVDRPAPTVRITSSSAARINRPAVRPFSAYAQEYGYVIGDLRRVVLISGGLLVVLIVLSFFVQ